MFYINNKLMAAIAVLFLAVAPFSFAGGDKEKKADAPANQTNVPAASTASEQEPPAPASPFFTGKGGKDISLTILAPKANGLADYQSYLPALVQGEFVSNFSGYSAVSVLDRIQLDEQYAELLSGYYSDDAKAGQDLGHLIPTTHLMTGTITKTATGYALQMQIAKNDDKITAASYSGTFTFAELDNLTGIRRASLELLEKIGVTPTDRTRTELTKGAAANHVNAQTTLAQGIAAQRQGTVVEALSYYIQSANYDPASAEAASRLNILTANVTSGNIGENVRNDLMWRDQWVARLKECEYFYYNYVKNPPPYNLVYSTDVVQGKIDYEKRTVDLSLEIATYPDEVWFKTLNQVINTVHQGLNATQRAQIWGLHEWPVKSIYEVNPFIDRIDGYTAVVEILNSEGKNVGGRQTIGLPTGFLINLIRQAPARPSRTGETTTSIHNYAVPVGGTAKIAFLGADPMAITDELSIKIVSINGASPEAAARQKNISIIPWSEYNGNCDNNIRCTQIRNPILEANVAMQVSPLSIRGITYSTWNITNKSGWNESTIGIIHHGNKSISDLSKDHFGLVVLELTRFSYLVIPESVTYIGRAGLYGNHLESIIIPKSVTSIGENILYGATSSNAKQINVFIGDNVKCVIGNQNSEYGAGGFQPLYVKNGRKAGVYIWLKIKAGVTDRIDC